MLLQAAWARPSGDPQLWHLLEADRRAQVRRLRNAADRERTVTANALLRQLIARWTGVPPVHVALGRYCRRCNYLTDHGKPVLLHHGSARTDLHVSVSHSGDRVLVAVCNGGPIGVDVEQVDAAAFDGFDDVALSDAERAELAGVEPAGRPLWRARKWTEKEAVLKATGHGLGIPPSDIQVRQRRVVVWPEEIGGQVIPPSGGCVRSLSIGHGYAASAALLAEAPSTIVLCQADSWLVEMGESIRQ